MFDTMTPAELLSAVRAALDETERVARRAGADQPRWAYDREIFTVSSGGWCIAARKDDGSPINDVDGEHIALHDPAAVLRRVAADRRVLRRHEPSRCQCGNAWHTHLCQGCTQPWPCPDFADLADRLGIDVGDAR